MSSRAIFVDRPRIRALVVAALTAACTSATASDPAHEPSGIDNPSDTKSPTGGTPGNVDAGNATAGGSTQSAGGTGPSAGGAVGPSPDLSVGASGFGATGGTPSTGNDTGGAWATTSSGSDTSSGAATGGAVQTTGGTSSGGAPVATGGAAKGGVPVNTGGVDTGGASSGGIGTGGAATGSPSSGCDLTAVATGTAIDGTMTVGNQERTYRLSVPTDYSPGEPLPLVFVFNGVGGTGPQAQQFFQLETEHRAIFVYPTALPNSEANGSIAWDFDRNGVDVPYFDALVAYLTQNYCIDTSRIFALGASSGAIMSNMLGCFRGEILRAIAPSSGMTWQQNGCTGDVAVMVICGTQDNSNRCDDASQGALSETNVWVPQNGCTQPTQTTQSPISSICQEFAGCRTEAPVLLCTHGGGHGWPTSDGDFWWQFFMSLN